MAISFIYHSDSDVPSRPSTITTPCNCILRAHLIMPIPKFNYGTLMVLIFHDSISAAAHQYPSYKLFLLILMHTSAMHCIALPKHAMYKQALMNE
jgi:hypothetical protein